MPRTNYAPRVLLAVLLLLGPGVWPRCSAAETFGHETFGRVLAAFVKDARVDYRALAARPQDLDDYLGRIAEIPTDAFARWAREERLALLINLYNASTLRLVADHYPVAGIKHIGLLPGSAWRREIVRFGGRTISLDHLEHEILRKEYREPRIHFALVCAAKGCPPLREEPFDPRRLDAQLDDQARRFLSDASKNRVDAATGTLWLSPIFEWFSADFGGDTASVVGFVRPLLPDTTRRDLETIGSPKVRFTEYDWSLNDRSRP